MSGARDGHGANSPGVTVDAVGRVSSGSDRPCAVPVVQTYPGFGNRSLDVVRELDDPRALLQYGVRNHAVEVRVDCIVCMVSALQAVVQDDADLP